MPPKPQWFQRLPEIIEEVSALTVPVVDRAILEKIFQLKRRATINLMARFGGYQVGKTYLVDQQKLIALLTEIQQGEDYQFEIRRRERVLDLLDKARKQRAAVAVSVPVEPDVYQRIIPELPEGVSLKPGELTITAESAEDLLRKLFELAQAISNDFDRFRQVVEDAGDR